MPPINKVPTNRKISLIIKGLRRGGYETPLTNACNFQDTSQNTPCLGLMSVQSQKLETRGHFLRQIVKLETELEILPML